MFRRKKLTKKTSKPEPTTKRCEICEGKGVNFAVSDTELCPACNGSGMVTVK